MQLTGNVAVVRAAEFKSEDNGFDPLVGYKGEGQFFFYPYELIIVQTCLCLTPIQVCGMHPNLWRALKIPYPSVVKEYSQWYGKMKKHYTQRTTRTATKKWVVP